LSALLTMALKYDAPGVAEVAASGMREFMTGQVARAAELGYEELLSTMIARQGVVFNPAFFRHKNKTLLVLAQGPALAMLLQKYPRLIDAPPHATRQSNVLLHAAQEGDMPKLCKLAALLPSFKVSRRPRCCGVH
jgi:hypothetical protein